MYAIFILLFIILIPVPFMRKAMISGRNPYKGVLYGALAGIAAAMLLFVVVKLQTGAGISDWMGQAFDQMLKAQDPKAFLKSVGAEGVTEKEFLSMMEGMKKVMQMTVPSVIIIWSVIIAYLDYRVISGIGVRCGMELSKLPPFRELTLPRSSLIGTIVIYFLAYLCGSIGFIDGPMMLLNVETLMNFIFCVQGAAVVFYFADMKRIPKAVTVIICILLLSMNIGKTIFFLLGLTEVVFRLRIRFKQKWT